MTARKHHIIPQCYLRGFCHDRSTEKLSAYDKSQQAVIPTNTGDAGAQRDFNRIEVPTQPIDALEAAYGKFENALTPFLMNILNRESIEDDDDLMWLLNLMSLMAARNIRKRDLLRLRHEIKARAKMDVVLQSPERWAQHAAQREAQGEIVNLPGKTLEETRIALSDYRVEVPQDLIILDEQDEQKKILEHGLRYRNWRLLKTEDATGFVTTDHPVAVKWATPTAQNAKRLPTFYKPDTEIVFPVSKHLLVLGRFENFEAPRIATLSTTAYMNAVAVLHAERWIYCADPNILHLTSGAQLARGEGIIKEDYMQPRLQCA